jgi:putative MATE family efflux protein
MQGERKTLRQLFFPICLETLCFMLAGMVDTLMLSSLGDEAVGAVGTANTYISVFIMMFSIVSSGMVAVMTQYIGAGKSGVAYQARQFGLVFNGILGIVLSLVLFFGSKSILEMIGIAKGLEGYAITYMKIVGGSVLLNALIPIFSYYVRAFGHTKQPMVATVVANIINLGLNALFLFVFKWGVAGVALATVTSRVFNLVIVIVYAITLVKVDKTERIKSGELVKQIIRVGLPSAAETALYNVAMTIMISFLNKMDKDGMNASARSYTAQITNFSYCVGAALAQANAILTGWRIGAGDYDACDRGTRKAAGIGILVAAAVESLLALAAPLYMHIFTDNPEMVSLVTKLLWIDVFLEIGRVTNLVYGQALKTSGDALFPTILGAIFMFLCTVGGTYLFGIKLELLVVGAYIGLAADECCRAIGMFIRFKSGKWRTKSFISR